MSINHIPNAARRLWLVAGGLLLAAVFGLPQARGQQSASTPKTRPEGASDRTSLRIRGDGTSIRVLSYSDAPRRAANALTPTLVPKQPAALATPPMPAPPLPPASEPLFVMPAPPMTSEFAEPAPTAPLAPAAPDASRAPATEPATEPAPAPTAEPAPPPVTEPTPPSAPAPAPAAPTPPPPVPPAPVPVAPVPVAPVPPPSVAVPPAVQPTPAAPPLMQRPSPVPTELDLAQPAPSPAIVPVPSVPIALTPRARCGVYCPDPLGRPQARWRAERPIPWEMFAQGEYVGPARLQHVPEYRLRVDDNLQFVYRLSGKVSPYAYRIGVRDRLQIQSLTAPQTVDRDVLVQPDGTITLRLLGQVRAAGYTIDELRVELDRLYTTHIINPSISVTPLELNMVLQELRAAVNSNYSAVGGQTREARVTPEGTIQLPAVGSVPAQGLTLAELGREIEERYAGVVSGLEVTPVLTARAPRYVYVVGEVRVPGRYAMEGPTTAMQAIALAGGWNVGAHLKHVVVFRRDDCWRMMATKLDLHAALFGKRPCPADEIWLRDSDLVLLPKSPLLATDDLINLVFTRGIYGVMPVTTVLNFNKLSTL